MDKPASGQILFQCRPAALNIANCMLIIVHIAVLGDIEYIYSLYIQATLYLNCTVDRCYTTALSFNTKRADFNTQSYCYRVVFSIVNISVNLN